MTSFVQAPNPVAPAKDVGDDPPRRRIVDRMDPRAVNLLTAFGFGIPIVGYFFLLSQYSVNVIVGDQWDDITVIRDSYLHGIDWNSLWALHNENRLLFPNLIVIVLAHTVHFNIQVEEYLGAVMLLAATALVIWAHKRRSPSTPWLYYCPVVFLTFSVVQWQNTLWGFQMAWYLVLLCFAASLVLLDRPTLSWWAFGVAIVVGVIGSFSSLQGLIIWPVGLLLLYHRRRAWSWAVVWIVAGASSIFLYFHNFSNAAGEFPNVAWQNPLLSTKFYLALIGDITGVNVSNKSPNDAVIVFGLVVVIVAVLTILICGIRRDERSGGVVGVALTCFGLLFAATVTQGRVIYGYDSAGQSRYTTFDLLVLVGVYLTLLGRSPFRSRATYPSIGSRGAEAASVPARFVCGAYRWMGTTGLTIVGWFVAGSIVVQIVFGLYCGLPGAKSNYEYKAEGAKVLQNFDQRSDSEVQYYLYIFESASWIRMQARFAEAHHLSLFDDDGSAKP